MLLKNGIYSLERPFPLLALLWKNNKSSMQTGHSSSCCWGISWSKLKICDSFTPALITHPTEHACATHGDQLKPIGQTTLTGKSKQSGRSERFSRPSVRAVTFARLKPRLMSSWTVRGAWPNHGCKGPGTSSVSKCWHLFLTGTVPHQGSQLCQGKSLGWPIGAAAGDQRQLLTERPRPKFSVACALSALAPRKPGLELAH